METKTLHESCDSIAPANCKTDQDSECQSIPKSGRKVSSGGDLDTSYVLEGRGVKEHGGVKEGGGVKEIFLKEVEGTVTSGIFENVNITTDTLSKTIFSSSILNLVVDVTSPGAVATGKEIMTTSASFSFGKEMKKDNTTTLIESIPSKQLITDDLHDETTAFVAFVTLEEENENLNDYKSSSEATLNNNKEQQLRDTICTELLALLPVGLVPCLVVVIPTMPLLGSGKMDRTVLREQFEERLKTTGPTWLQMLEDKIVFWKVSITEKIIRERCCIKFTYCIYI